MSKIEKLIKNILRGKQISYKEAEKILIALGFNVKITGSHHIFRKLGSPHNISLKKRPQLLPYQVKMLREVLINYGYKDEE